MAIQDKQGEFSNAQAITASAAASQNIDLGPRIGPGLTANGARNTEIGVSIDQSFTAGGAATLSIGVRSSDNADMSSAVTHYQTPAIPVASLVAGAKLDDYLQNLRIPPHCGRYVDLYYTVATGPMTAGKITARVQAGRQDGY